MQLQSEKLFLADACEIMSILFIYKNVHFNLLGPDAKVGSQETCGVTGRFGLE